MEVSPTRLKVFGQCANQYKYQYVLRLPGELKGAYTVLGVVFHFTLDVYEQYGHDLALAIRTFRHYWDHPEELGEKIDWYPPRTSHKGLGDQGVEMLERYHDLHPWKGGELVGTEIRFEVPLGPHTVRGVIDKLFWRPEVNELQVIDFKTGVKVPERLRYNSQFTCYLYATTRPEFWAEIPGYEHFWPTAMGAKRLGQWFHARSSKMFNAGYRDDSDYRRLLLAIDQMEQAIEHNIYPLTIEGEACGWCSWREDCGTEVELPTSSDDHHRETALAGDTLLDIIASDS